ncbi:unnamed protein product [Euphydryas editha]|uniref:CHK kinase-like domain-containing protein n=1 Tax=Euphydryas editha TaxID=104508 RepID=A0AAU9TUM0_EUPED|nr:unnamed protein product [Euphydryas editha]
MEALQVLKPSSQESVMKLIEKINFIQYDMVIKCLDVNGQNILGKLYEINIKGKTITCDKEINIFLKEKIVLKTMKFFDTDQLYANELFMYKEISRIFTSLQDQANIPPEDRYKLPRFYDESNNEVIILENLSKKGFRVYNKNEPVPLKFLELGVQAMAKLHALSFVIENKMPKFFEDKIKVLVNTMNFDEDIGEMLQNVCEYVANLYEDETKTKIKNYVPVLLDKLPKYLRDKTDISTICHCDYKKFNIMVRITNGDPVEVMPVDYQLIDYGCPMRDLLLFLFSTTDQQFRKKHLNDLKELYFETLSRFLKYFDMDVETVYPRKKFEKIYTEWLDFGLMITLLASIALYAPDTGLDLENLSCKQLPFCPNKTFNHVIRGLIDDYVQWGIL